jgi:hypothetical protein
MDFCGQALDYLKEIDFIIHAGDMGHPDIDEL